MQLIAAGVVRTRRDTSFPQRLRTLYDGVDDVIRRFNPDIFVIEETFYNSNAKTSLLLGHARGALILAAAHHELEVVEYSAKAVKKALTGNGSADKEQIRYMVQRLLNIRELPDKSLDLSDALAVALTHHHQLKFEQLLEKGQ